MLVIIERTKDEIVFEIEISLAKALEYHLIRQFDSFSGLTTLSSLITNERT